MNRDAFETLAVHELRNSHGDRVELASLGARIRSLTLALPSGPRDVVLGLPALEDHLADAGYVGATVGRYCNRIGGASYTIDGERFELTANEGANQLHGGPVGFDKRTWNIAPGADERAVTFRLRSMDGDQGHPGNLDVEARYEWGDDRVLRIGYRAVTDRPTHVNLTNHAYFDLDARDERGAEPADVRDHVLRIASDAITPTDGEQIPTGRIETVRGTALDLRRAQRVRTLVDSDDPRIAAHRGADLNYMLGARAPAAELASRTGDLGLRLTTSYPALQLYTGQHLAPPLHAFAGLCLEAQYPPDAPNQPAFPDTLLRPGREYAESIEFSFESY